MTPIELKAEIETGPLAADLAPFVAAGNDGMVAEILNDKRYTGLSARIVNARTVMAEYPAGPAAAATLLDKLDSLSASVPAVKWAMGFIKGDGIDIGHPSTQGMLDQLAAGGLITTAEAANLKQMGVVPKSRAEVLGVTIDITAVARALRNDDGSPK